MSMIAHQTGHRSVAMPPAPKSAFIFAPSTNRDGLRDAAHFQRKARAFRDFYGFADVFEFDNDQDNDGAGDGNADTRARRQDIYGAIELLETKIDTVAYFGHGRVSGLSSAGIGPLAIDGLCERLAAKATNRLTVVLYACLSGRPNGAAQAMRVSLQRHGVDATIVGHETPGEATVNPYKRRYPVGDYIVAPGSEHWDAWRNALRTTNLWMRMPYMTTEAIHAELASQPAAA